MILSIFGYAVLGSLCLLLIFGIFSAITFGIGQLDFKRNKKKSEITSDTFVEYLFQGLTNKTVNNYDDLIKLFRGVYTNVNKSDIEKKLLNYNLHKMFAIIIRKKYSQKLDTNELNEIKNKISDFISINKKELPFLDLPDIEKNIFKDIIVFLESNNKEEIIRKINELNDITLIRYEGLKNLEKNINSLYHLELLVLL